PEEDGRARCAAVTTPAPPRLLKRTSESPRSPWQGRIASAPATAHQGPESRFSSEPQNEARRTPPAGAAGYGRARWLPTATRRTEPDSTARSVRNGKSGAPPQCA